ncbi:hypothetical protein M011DRAFT_152764 [Sporormia fimetaria CBS 119925]|uniref:Uncharacterized protein n=1 Tax=Sporormia fimetaria CBS 119925 TaxID=1340428 RepID=A0A6A6V368_9PLEO|nr:hypothetical protein M011DRAFT_152764 [Sporormia fimetaria CBS 119925]
MPYFYVEPLSGVLNRAGWCEKYAQSFTACKSGAAFRKRSLADMAHMPLLPPTLDEYHYPALTQAALDQRNKDQVLKKYGKGVSGEELIICVHQLWIWDISGVHIDLIYPYHVDDDFPALINDFLSIINEDYSDPEGIRAVAIGVLMSRMIDMLEARPKTLMSRSILAVFESALADLSEQVRLYAKKIDFAEVDIDEEKRFFHEIADIQNELAMIKSVLLQQEEVWRDYAYNMWPDQWEGGREGRFLLPQDYGVLDQDTWREVLRPQTQFQKYKRRIAHIEDEAQRVEKTITAFLDLKQKHATMQETHATGVMSAAVVGFTVITIIFTPLSFLVALFALPIDTFQDRQTVSRFTDESGTYSRGYIAKWAGELMLVSGECFS